MRRRVERVQERVEGGVAAGTIREAIEGIITTRELKLWAQRIHPAQTVESRKIAVGRAEV